MRTSPIPPLALLPFAFACGGAKPVTDRGQICFDRDLALVASSDDCAADHEGATFTCSATLDGTTVTATTSFTEGDDANDACGGPIIADCGLTLPPGPHTIVFRGESHEVDVQAENAGCVPSGRRFDTGG